MSLEILFSNHHLPTSWIVIRNPQKHLDVVGRGFNISHTGHHLHITMEWYADKKGARRIEFNPEHNRVFEFDLRDAHITQHEDEMYYLSCGDDSIEFHIRRPPISLDRIMDLPEYLHKAKF